MRCVLIGLTLVAACGKVENLPTLDGGDTDASSGPVTITFTSQRGGSAQVANTGLVAYQDGDGPWQVVTGTDGVYKLSVSTGRYGLLAACERTPDGATFVSLGYFAVSDGPDRFGLDFCTAGTMQTVTISGTVSGTAMGEDLWISDGIFASAGLVTNWTMPAVPGPGTLIGMRRTGERPTAMLLQRVTFAADATFNLNFTNQFFPAESELTLDPTGGGTPTMQTTYIDESGGDHRIDFARAVVTKYRVVPADRVGTGISLLSQSASSGGASRRVERAFQSPVAQTLTLPPAYLLPSPPRVLTTTPYAIVEATLPRRTGASHYTVNYFVSVGATFRSWDLMYSAAWVNATPGTELVTRLPDFSSLPGWKASYGLGAPGGSWSASVSTGPTRLMPGVSRFSIQGRPRAAYQVGDETTRSASNGTLP